MATPRVPLADLLAGLSDPDSAVRRAAIKKIMRRKTERGQAFDDLARLLTDSDYRVRKLAIQALSKLGDARALPYLARGLQDRTFGIRLLSVRMLAASENPSAIPHLIGVLSDASASVRGTAMEALLELDRTGAQVIPHVLQALRDEADPLRVRILKMLLTQHGVQAVPFMVAALTDPSSVVRHLASGYLTQIGYTNRQVVLDLLPLATYPVRETRDAVFTILQSLNDPRAFTVLVQGLRDQDQNIRVIAAFTLGNLKDSRAVEPLLAACGDSEGLVRARVAEALGKLKDQRALATLLALADDADRLVCAYALQALSGFDTQRAIPALVANAARIQESFLRRNALQALCSLLVAFPAEIAAPEVVELLLSCLGDSDSQIREAVKTVFLASPRNLWLPGPFLHILSSETLSPQRLVAALRVVELAGCGTEAQVQAALRALIEQENVYTPARAQAIGLLGRSGDTSVVEPLLGLLAADDLSLREAASEALGRLGDERALEPLRALLARTSPGYLNVLVRAAIALLTSAEERASA